MTTIRFTDEDTAFFCTQLSLLLHAGVSTGDALALLAEEEKEDGLLAALAQKADLGSTLSDALKESGAFPAYLCGLVEVGEQTGRVEEALSSLAGYYEDRVRLRRRVRSAVLYPAVMLALMLVVIGVLLVKVLPVFDDVYASLGGRLTGVAGGLLALGRGLERAVPVLGGILLLLLLFGLGVAFLPSLRERLSLWWQERYGDKGVARQLNTARLAQALAMGMASGLPVEEAVDLSANLMEAGAKRRCQDCSRLLGEGRDLSEALRESSLLPPRQCRVLELGQRGGVGDRSMAKIAEDLSEEGEAALDALVSRVEPALVLVCSLLVGLILLSVMLPLMNIMAAIG